MFPGCSFLAGPLASTLHTARWAMYQPVIEYEAVTVAISGVPSVSASPIAPYRFPICGGRAGGYGTGHSHVRRCTDVMTLQAHGLMLPLLVSSDLSRCMVDFGDYIRHQPCGALVCDAFKKCRGLNRGLRPHPRTE